MDYWNSGMEIFESSFSKITHIPKKPAHLHYFQHFCGSYTQNLTIVMYLMMLVSMYNTGNTKRLENQIAHDDLI